MRSLRSVVPVLALAALAVAAAQSRAARPAMTAPSPAGSRAVLPFLADDWPKAMALAKARQLPVFVEAWAPW